jgi:carbamoyltransferase|tara:strand:+ start:2088 stop:3938 length:1851 start_codon:yes stop_codon:yes gene_type:complete
MKNSKEIVIGIYWGQNSTASLMVNGEIIACVSEERFSRTKNDERYPIQAINWLLKRFKIEKKEIKAVCFPSIVWPASYIITRRYTTYSNEDYWLEQKKIWYPRIYLKKKISHSNIFKNKIDLNQYPGKRFWKKFIKNMQLSEDHVSNKDTIPMGQQIRSEVLKKHLGIEKNKIKFIDHHTGHAAYAYFSTGEFENKTLVLTLDSFGDYINYTAHLYTPKKNKVLEIKKISEGSNFIIGRLYRYITLILGFKPDEHEYKVMGLAPYCKAGYSKKVENIFKTFQTVRGTKFVYKNKPKDLFFYVKKKIEGQRFDSIAAGLQSYADDLIVRWVKNCIKKTKVKNICLAGGVGMNVKTNMLISKISKNINLFVPPSPNDISTAMGACYGYYLSEYKKKILNKVKPIKHTYLGPEVDLKIIEKKIKRFYINKKYLVIKNKINHEAAKILANNKIVARFCGNAEFGARALGNRSILANPKNNFIKKIINESVKNRDFWMPFAASVPAKFSKKYFKIDCNIKSYSYMTNCTNTTNEGKKKLAAALHPYDETCRPHIIANGQNDNYKNLIMEFGKITGIYALLNTSFNLHGHPIVNSIEDAINIFIKSNIDALLLPRYLIIKKI